MDAQVIPHLRRSPSEDIQLGVLPQIGMEVTCRLYFETSLEDWAAVAALCRKFCMKKREVMQWERDLAEFGIEGGSAVCSLDVPKRSLNPVTEEDTANPSLNIKKPVQRSTVKAPDRER